MPALDEVLRGMIVSVVREQTGRAGGEVAMKEGCGDGNEAGNGKADE